MDWVKDSERQKVAQSYYYALLRPWMKEDRNGNYLVPEQSPLEDNDSDQAVGLVVTVCSIGN